MRVTYLHDAGFYDAGPNLDSEWSTAKQLVGSLDLTVVSRVAIQ